MTRIHEWLAVPYTDAAMGLRVLFIDQDQFFTEICAKRFKESEADLLCAARGCEGIALAEKEQPHAIVLDLKLAEGDGFQVLESLISNERTKDIPLFVYTSLGTKEDIERCLELGAAEYLLKTQHPPESVLSLIQRVIADVSQSKAKTVY
ncbi:MAG TPA: response regulator [Patescibacteria group bacterium]|nr:response regulator [Patescibacteria group bacterium]